MDFLRYLFTELNSEYSYYLYTWMIGSFLIGWLARYFLARSKQKTLNVALDKSKLELKQAKNQKTSLQGKLDLKEADYKKASLELKDKNTLVESLGTEKRQISSRLKSTLGDYEKVKVEHTQTTARLEELNDQILGLRTKNSQLNTEIQQSNQTINQYADTQSSAEEQQELRSIIKRLQVENTNLKKQASIASVPVPVSVPIANEAYEAKLTDAKAEITELKEGNEALSNSINTLVEQNEAMQEQLDQLPQYEEGNAALNASILQLIEQNEMLKAQVEDLNQYESGNDILNSTISQLIEENDSLKVNTPTEANAVVSAVPSTTMSSEELDTEQAKAEIRAAIGKQIVAVSASEKDDLKKINGIGPFIEEKLNDLGIYSFKQVSQLGGLLPVLTTAIEFFPGRIDRDEWIGQADRLAFMKKSSSNRRRSVSATTIPDESFTTEKTAVQEKIIVGDKPIRKVIRRTPIRRVIKAESSIQKAAPKVEVKAESSIRKAAPKIEVKAESSIRKVASKVEAKTEPSIQKAEAKAVPKVELPPLPTVPPVEKIAPPPTSAAALKEVSSRKIVVPPVIVEKTLPVVNTPEPVVQEIPVPVEPKIERKIEAKIPDPVETSTPEQEPVPIPEPAPVANDLKKIEGIGPKLSKVLNTAGIISFKQLAAKSTSELQDILDDAGPRYRIARPKSWPMQAKMAAAGEWDKLKSLQNEMKGGILPD